MEIFKFFVCFAIAESVTAELSSESRAKPPLRVDDVRRVIEKTSEYDEFLTLLNKNYIGRKIRRAIDATEKNTIFYDLLAVNEALKASAKDFMFWSSKYLLQCLRKYCDLALELIIFKIDGAAARDKLETLRFSGQHGYCVFTAFNDSAAGLGDERLPDGDLLFETLFLFQTIDPDDESSLSLLNTRMRLYKIRFDKMAKLAGIGSIPRHPTPDTVLKGYRVALAEVEKRIADFSREFCSIWKPMVPVDLFRSEPPAEPNAVHRQSAFVRHALQSEIFRVNTEIQMNDVYPKNQQYLITWWNCNKILESEEYRYQTYKENKITAMQTSTAPSNPWPKRNVFEKVSEFSLATLKEALKSNTYYLNAVKYYNVMADVLLSVSIKEGRKILKGIKLAAAPGNGTSEQRLSVDELREMRSALSEFKSVLDDLVFLLVREKRITVRMGDQTKSFGERADLIVGFLDAVQNERATEAQVDRICARIANELADLRVDASAGDNWIKFKQFYFTESILHVRQLYGYSANNF